MTSIFFWQNSVSFCPASFCTPRPNLPVITGISWFPTFTFQFLMMKRTFFFLLLVIKVVVSLHRTSQLQLLWHQWLECRLGLLWCWIVYLGNKMRSFCHFWDCTQVLHFRLIVYNEGYSISSKGFLPTVVLVWCKSNWGWWCKNFDSWCKYNCCYCKSSWGSKPQFGAIRHKINFESLLFLY